MPKFSAAIPFRACAVPVISDVIEAMLEGGQAIVLTPAPQQFQHISGKRDLPEPFRI
jgi:hypothetical protein